jgi:hypothetical protein
VRAGSNRCRSTHHSSLPHRDDDAHRAAPSTPPIFAFARRCLRCSLQPHRLPNAHSSTPTTPPRVTLLPADANELCQSTKSIRASSQFHRRSLNHFSGIGESASTSFLPTSAGLRAKSRRPECKAQAASHCASPEHARCSCHRCKRMASHDAAVNAVARNACFTTRRGNLMELQLAVDVEMVMPRARANASFLSDLSPSSSNCIFCRSTPRSRHAFVPIDGTRAVSCQPRNR